MKVSFLLSFTLIAAGCTTSDRTAEDVAAVVAGRAGDGAAGEIQRARKDDRRIREAYDLGVLQATKSLHAAIHATQQTDLAERSSPDQTLVPLTIPERTIDGAIINPGVEYVRLPR